MASHPKTLQGRYAAIDAVCLAFVAGLILVCIAAPSRVPGCASVAGGLCAAGTLYCAASAATRLLRDGQASTWAITAGVTLLLSYLYQAIAPFQHVLVRGWLDGLLITWERGVTGTECTLALQSIACRWITEWMMFAYVAYVPLLPVTSLLCCRTGGAAAAREFLLALAATNTACFALFLVIPVAGPLFYQPEAYSVPLTGGFFTWCAGLLHASAHYPGGSLPSPHCASTTVMLVMLYRHNRRAFAVALPTLLSIYLSTVYGRYHYAWDSAAGILMALAMIRVCPRIEKLMTWIASSLRNAPRYDRSPSLRALCAKQSPPGRHASLATAKNADCFVAEKRSSQ